jgi:hypothetical protein
VLAYTAAALKQELALPKPRPEGRNLILMFMAFSLIAFGIATYIEIEKRRTDVDSLNKLGTVRNILSSNDANLGGKYQLAVSQAPESIKSTLQYFEDNLCRDVKKMRLVLDNVDQSQCTLSSP